MGVLALLWMLDGTLCSAEKLTNDARKCGFAWIANVKERYVSCCIEKYLMCHSTIVKLSSWMVQMLFFGFICVFGCFSFGLPSSGECSILIGWKLSASSCKSNKKGLIIITVKFSIYLAFTEGVSRVRGKNASRCNARRNQWPCHWLFFYNCKPPRVQFLI